MVKMYMGDIGKICENNENYDFNYESLCKWKRGWKIDL